MFKKVIEINKFLTKDLWNINLNDSSKKKLYLIRKLRIIISVFEDFKNDKCQLRAAALTFYTILSIVPALAIGYYVAKGFGYEKTMENSIINFFPLISELLTKAFEITKGVVYNTKKDLVAIIGIIILFWSVMRVLSSVESSFNDIWRVKKHRTLVRKFTDYFTIMIITPIFIISSKILNDTVKEVLLNFASKTGSKSLIKMIMFLSLKFAPFLVICLLFSIIYIIMPNTKVKLKTGLVSGLVAGFLYQILQIFYIKFQFGLSRYNEIYGSLAFLPIFLIWIRLSWSILLLGVELAFSYQTINKYEVKIDRVKLSNHLKKQLALLITSVIVKNFEKINKPISSTEISLKLKLPLRIILEIINKLIASNVITEVNSMDEKENGYNPSFDINKLRVMDVLCLLDKKGGNYDVDSREEFLKLNMILDSFESLNKSNAGNILLKDL